ncbi:unnamed protein product, partial [Pleuronectes platessa]
AVLCGHADCVTLYYPQGDLIPEGELAWQVILDLKEIVELVVAPVHTHETIAYLDVKVSEHRHRLLELIPGREVALVQLEELTDYCPLVAYTVGSRRMVTLKRHIVITD